MTGKIYQNIPDSVGMNVFQADPAMADLLRIYLPPAILPTALAECDVELRAVDSLVPLRGVWSSSLHASGIRLRNAVGWEA